MSSIATMPPLLSTLVCTFTVQVFLVFLQTVTDPAVLYVPRGVFKGGHWAMAPPFGSPG